MVEKKEKLQMSDSRFEPKANMKSKLSPSRRRRFMTCTANGGGVGELLETRFVLSGYEWRCGNCQGWHFQQTNDSVQFVPFWHEHLGHEPVYIDSWKTYRQKLAEIGPHVRNELAS